MALAVLDSKDGFSVTGAVSGTYGPYVLLGGKYLFTSTAPGTSTTLKYLQPDGTTYQAVGSSTTLSAAGDATVDLPPCTVQVVVVTVSAVAFALARVPYRRA